jgi:sugar phosphate isomerase/epimerase
VEIHSVWHKTVEELDENEAREVERLLKKYEMRVSCLSTTLFLMCPLYTRVDLLEKFSDKFLQYTGTMDEHFEMLRKCAELCKRFGTEYIRIFPFRKEPHVQRDFHEYLRDIQDRFVQAIEIAESQNTVLIIENCPYSYLPRGYMTFQLATRISSKRFALLYDIGNSFKSEDLSSSDEWKKVSVFEEYERIKELVRHFHFKDYKKTDHQFIHAVLGEGDVGFAEMYSRIKGSNTGACISLEPEVDGEGVVKSIRNFIAMQKSLI